MNVDREQQAEILQILFDAYPWTTNEVSSKIQHMLNTETSRTVGNLLYLQMHGLISDCIKIVGLGYEKLVSPDFECKLYNYQPTPTLTEKGIDFLMRDEGLSSVLNTRRIVIDESSLRTLIEQFILRSAIAEEQKSIFIEELRKTPAKALANWILKITGMSI